jgi:hypothetical protein
MDNQNTTSTANNDNASPQLPSRHRGSCHCGAVRFEVTADLTGGGSRCNCSVCSKIGGLGIIVPPEALTVLSSEAELGEYVWGGKISRRYFCKQCGIHTFSRGYLAELGGAFAGVNLNTLDGIDPGALAISYWDGRHDNWMAGTRPTPWPIFAAAA